MDSSRESFKRWLSGVLTAAGVYGATADRPAVFDPDRDPKHATRPKQTQGLSCVVITGRLTVAAAAAAGAGQRTDDRVSVKLKPAAEQFRTLFRTDKQFHNEIHAYRNVVPFLLEHLPEGARAPALPHFVYGRNECNDRWSEDSIVLEDPRYHGYTAARNQEPGSAGVYLDYEHLAVAIGALGRFHGMSLTAKQKNPVGFRKIVNHLREIQWDDDGWLVKDNVLKSLGMRGARPLMEQEQYGGGKLKGFLNMIREAERNLNLVMTPKEPFAVICHGDYCKANILFEYDECGQPRDAMITELTAVRYGSPGLDLSYFLYKNASQDVQNDRWEDLLAVYLESMEAVLPADVKAPTMKLLHRELRFHALYGYAHLLFSVPSMINDDPAETPVSDGGGGGGDNVTEDGHEQPKTIEEQLVARIDAADDKITKILSATVRHIIDHGYAEQYEYSNRIPS